MISPFRYFSAASSTAAFTHHNSSCFDGVRWKNDTIPYAELWSLVIAKGLNLKNLRRSFRQTFVEKSISIIIIANIRNWNIKLTSSSKVSGHIRVHIGRPSIPAKPCVSMHVIVIVRLQSGINDPVRREASAFLRHSRRRCRVFALVPSPSVPIPLATPFLARDTIRLDFRPRTLDGQPFVLGREGRVYRIDPVVQMRIGAWKIIFNNCYRRMFVKIFAVNRYFSIFLTRYLIRYNPVPQRWKKLRTKGEFMKETSAQ